MVQISERCTGCGACISKCPEKALEFFTVDYVKKVRCIAERCTDCGKCISVCRFKAISNR